MTEQHAEPTPGPYYVWLPRSSGQGCRAIRTEKGRTHGTYRGTEIAYTVGLSNDAVDKANANLLAASWETAAERDRLVTLLAKVLDICGQNVGPLGRSYKILCLEEEIRAALAEAQKQ